jgi:hypothetical protein
MAEKTLNTRISLKYGAIGQWSSTFKPLKGEVCFAEVATEKKDAAGNIISVPAVVFKVGDGEKTFSQLPWASALAADVYDWAKSETVVLDGEVLKFKTGETVNHSIDLGVFATNADLEQLREGLEADTNDNTTYTFEIPENGDNKGKLVITETPHVLGVAGAATTTVLDFVTPDELTAALSNYYTKEEADARFQPIGDYQPAGNYKTVQTAVGNKITDAAHVLASLTQNTNGEVAYEVKELTPADIGAQPAGNYKTKQQAVNETGAENKTLKISQNDNGVITAIPVEIKITASQVTDFTDEVAEIEVNKAKAAAKVDNKLKVGTKSYDGSAAVEVTAAVLGLESAMHFIGAFAEAPENPKAGDVYLNTATKKEYVYSNGWVELGDEGSYALRSVTITSNEGLTGGGDLTTNRTIGIADSGVTTAKIADGNVTLAKLASDVQGSLTKADNAVQHKNCENKTTEDFIETISAHDDNIVVNHVVNEGTKKAGISLNIDKVKESINLGNYKTVQTAVADPTANGKSLTFIDTISQNTNGVITATKKNVNLDDYALKSELPTVNDGKFTVSGTGMLTGSGEMTANQAGNTTATLDLTEAAKTSLGKADTAIQEVTAGIGIKAVKTGTTVNLELVGKNETDDDGNAVTFIFDCGGAE